MERIIENPMVKDRVEFIQTVEESEGRLTWIRIRLAAKGGSEMHFHEGFSETFIARKGCLGLYLGNEPIIMAEGETFTVPPLALHRFFNPQEHPIEFDVKIEPGSRSFEEFLQIMYGLAREGKTTQKGIPKHPLAIGAIGQLGETLPPKGSFLHLASPLLRRLGRMAERTGYLDQLRAQYVAY